MIWKPSQPREMITTANFDLDSSLASVVVSNGESSGCNKKKFKRKFASSGGVPSFEWPEISPVIFPGLDDLAADDGGQVVVKMKNGLRRSSNFVEEYMDRRARAKWAGRHPQSMIANAGPKETFKSIYSDPNHAASSGDLLALLTGGRVQLPSLPVPGRFGGRNNNKQTSGGEGRSSSTDGGIIRKAKTGAVPTLLSGTLTLLKNDILYLVIVNRPTQQQLAEASTLLRSSQES
ncbi:hypothetical protein DTO271G3_6280 [Paecilomyces variotii]|nr:hypothetical protein DTO271G3_6280 [Paecilomyces variotii]